MNEKFDVKITFGNNVKNTRLKQNISQEKLGDLTGLHRTYISEVERGRRNVSLENIYAISKALNVKMSELLDF
ncbi:helix-turn-helix transcriptional regulator [Aquibacillus sp. 3ASR75-11]|uniref:Helix-turn-helix transcriptional regulator n=1 Tax=Terrihalobacillus insolitus TaxID=2950438 RepID=A0A9X4AM16_9BACI|nr:helix-turn-helix transcriptional regulator [Terrihalobacillus insolitus]MDC3424359.1 helix-turn-helix transcriptional regulator [Terrihalobacillus insolitus]